MLLIGQPPHASDKNTWYIADADEAFILQQKGAVAYSQDGDVYYFKKSKKFAKVAKKCNINID